MGWKKTTLVSAMSVAMGAASFSTFASLTTAETLNFTLGQVADVGGGQTDIVGSYFAFDFTGDGIISANDKLPIGSFNGIRIGAVQGASGSHTGPVDGSENPNIDHPWEMLGSTGMHQTTTPVTVNGGSGDNLTLDMSGWGFTWNGIPNVPLNQTGAANISCTAGSGCSAGSNYILDAAFTGADSGSGFTTAPYVLHLEGNITTVPLPATAWLFGSGLAGLAGVTRRRRRRG